MAKKPVRYDPPVEETDEGDTATVVHSSPVRRRVQIRAPEEMAGMTVSVLIPNQYLPKLMRAYLDKAEDGSVLRRGRKDPHAIMVRQLIIEGLAQLAGEDVEDTSAAMAEAEQAEAELVRAHKERHGL
jgi:hypothetical protein